MYLLVLIIGKSRVASSETGGRGDEVLEVEARRGEGCSSLSPSLFILFPLNGSSIRVEMGKYSMSGRTWR
jgi:hypothetical protein